jgi:hypothetical protein
MDFVKHEKSRSEIEFIGFVAQLEMESRDSSGGDKYPRLLVQVFLLIEPTTFARDGRRVSGKQISDRKLDSFAHDIDLWRHVRCTRGLRPGNTIKNKSSDEAERKFFCITFQSRAMFKLDPKTCDIPMSYCKSGRVITNSGHNFFFVFL